MADGTAALCFAKVCIAPAAVVLSPDGTRAIVACTGEDSLAVVDTRTLAVTARVPAGPQPTNKPTALARNAAGTLVAVSNQISREVVVFELGATPTARVAIAVAGVPAFATWLVDSILVPLQDPNGATLLDAATGAVLRTVTYGDDACRAPSDAQVADDGRVFLVCEGDHYRPGAVVRLDPETLAVTGRVEVGLYPDRLAVRGP
jgi:YVTN family beta-propeller protein